MASRAPIKQKFDWKVPLRRCELESAIAELKPMFWRGVVMAVLLAIFVWPFCDWIQHYQPRPMSLWGRLVLMGLMFVWPASVAIQSAYYTRLIGRINSAQPPLAGFKLDSRGIFRHNGELIVLWRHIVAFQELPRDEDGNHSIELLRANGRLRLIPLPAAPAERMPIVAAIASQVARYDRAQHGELDIQTDVPAWVAWSLVGLALITLAGTAGVAWVFADLQLHDREKIGPTTVYGCLLAPLILVGLWYAVVRRELNAAQRDRAIAYAAVCWMGLTPLYLLVLCCPTLLNTFRYLDAQPKSVVETVGRGFNHSQ